jgi:hypothetical protein
VLSAFTTSLLIWSSSCLCGMWLYVVYVCVCLMYLSMGCSVVNIPQTNTSGTHIQTTYSHIPNKELDDANKQRTSNSTKHERRPPEDGQTIVTETCRVLVMSFTNIFNNLVFQM